MDHEGSCKRHRRVNAIRDVNLKRAQPLHDRDGSIQRPAKGPTLEASSRSAATPSHDMSGAPSGSGASSARAMTTWRPHPSMPVRKPGQRAVAAAILSGSRTGRARHRSLRHNRASPSNSPDSPKPAWHDEASRTAPDRRDARSRDRGDSRDQDGWRRSGRERLERRHLAFRTSFAATLGLRLVIDQRIQAEQAEPAA